MRQMLTFFMRDFIRKVINEYLAHLRDTDIPEGDYIAIEDAFTTFQTWLYQAMKVSGESKL